MKSNYVTASQTNLKTINKYFDISFETVATKMTQLSGNDAIRNYYSGYYKKDMLKELSQYKEIEKLIATNTASDKIVQNVFVFIKRDRFYSWEDEKSSQ